MTSALKSAIDGLSPAVWAKKRAERLLETTGQRDPEVDLGPILKRRRVQKIIVESDLIPEARLIPENTGFNVRVKKSRYLPTRGRFSIAHELGHTFFYNLDYEPPRRLEGLPYPDDSEELLCDRFAAELLMPSNIVTPLFQDLSTGGDRVHESILKRIHRLSEIFSVSITTMCIRLICELNLWDGLIIICQWLPKNGNQGQNSGDHAWRISNCIFDHNKYPNLFVPYPNSYVNNYPSIKWPILDELSDSMKVGSIKTIDIPNKNVQQNGSLLDLLHRLKGYNLFYKFGAMLVSGNRQKDIDKTINSGDDNFDKRELVFLISVDF